MHKSSGIQSELMETSPSIEPSPAATGAHSAVTDGHTSKAVVLGALGVVFGDIGTSPLYALRECFHGSHAVLPSRENIFGVLSLIAWALIIEVTLKYLMWVMRANNRGEGGELALMALAAHPQRKMRKSDKRRYLIALGLFGAALLYGDGIVTPAISVTSAVEGLAVATSFFEPFILPITVVILIGLFCIQYRGTAHLGRMFGPVILTWFAVIGILGACSIFYRPEVLLALNPYYGISFFATNGWSAFVVVGTVFLSVTGGEALYADMGHFGRKPIKTGWFCCVLPALALNYFGQGALLLRDPGAAENPFYKLAPEWFLYPLVAIATIATVIASQALISGAFSMTRQAVQLGCLPRISILHTSSEAIGQIYVPLVNRVLLLMTILFVLTFRSSSAMAAAYGVGVSTTMVITTLLTYFVTRESWGWSKPLALSVAGSFLIIDLTFFCSNITKIHHGGWVPLAIGAGAFLIMTTWRTGRQILARRLKAQTSPFSQFIAEVTENPPIRVPGTAIFMTGNPEGTPPALIHNLKHNRVLHDTVVLLMVMIEEVPHVSEKVRVTVEQLQSRFHRVTIRYGFMEEPNVPEIIEHADDYGLDFDTSSVVYFLGRETVLATERDGMAIWREKLFAFLSRNAQRATLFYQIPPEQVIEIGLQVEI